MASGYFLYDGVAKEESSVKTFSAVEKDQGYVVVYRYKTMHWEACYSTKAAMIKDIQAFLNESGSWSVWFEE
jgi:hypothetical protein